VRRELHQQTRPQRKVGSDRKIPLTETVSMLDMILPHEIHLYHTLAVEIYLYYTLAVVSVTWSSLQKQTSRSSKVSSR
jgi:hypothetical protein